MTGPAEYAADGAVPRSGIGGTIPADTPLPMELSGDTADGRLPRSVGADEGPRTGLESGAGSTPARDRAVEDAIRIAEACVVHPGDVLVLSVGGPVTRAEFDRLVADVRKELPETIKLLIVGGAIQLHVLRPGEVES
jgi:hypothetical protein